MLTFEKKDHPASINNKNSYSFIHELIKCGVRHFCVGSGKRSAVLASAIHANPLAKVFAHYDERSLGFFALGIAKCHPEPVAILVTSGTALANLYPSIVEARQSHQKIIVLASNRPEELMDTGANQTIDQSKMFSTYVYQELSMNFSDPSLDPSYVKRNAARLYFLSKQYDISLMHASFKEPITCMTDYTNISETPPKTVVAKTCKTLEKDSLYEIHHKLNKAKTPLIIIGESQEPSSLIFGLAQKLQAPVYLDILSNLRNHMENPCYIPYYELILQSRKTLKHIHHDLILHFGKSLVANKILEYLQPKDYLHIDPSNDRIDTKNLVTDRISLDPNIFCRQVHDDILQKKDLSTLKSLKDYSVKAKNHFYKYVHTYKDLDELYFFYTLINHPIDEYQLFFGNSMPIRYANTLFFPYSKIAKVFANRGCSGIDGNIATALGIHSQATGPSICILGDLTALHDFNSFMINHKSPLPILFVVFNNQEGGIFHHLDMGLTKKELEKSVSLKHTMNFQTLAKAFQLQYFNPKTREELESHLICALNSQSALMEIKVDAASSFQHYQNLMKKSEKNLAYL